MKFIPREHKFGKFNGTKAWSPGISTVLHWRPPDVHIFGTDPSLVTVVRSLVVRSHDTFVYLIIFVASKRMTCGEVRGIHLLGNGKYF